MIGGGGCPSPFERGNLARGLGRSGLGLSWVCKECLPKRGISLCLHTIFPVFAFLGGLEDTQRSLPVMVLEGSAGLSRRCIMITTGSWALGQAGGRNGFPINRHMRDDDIRLVDWLGWLLGFIGLVFSLDGIPAAESVVRIARLWYWEVEEKETFVSRFLACRSKGMGGNDLGYRACLHLF